MSERLVKYKLFLAWQDDREERWLEEMARQGWHLVEGGIRFVFRKGAPEAIRYRLDYRRRFPDGKGEYFAMFRDAGWEYVCGFVHWHYFRSPASANAPEIYTDVESRVDMYRQLQRVLLAVMFLNLIMMNNSLRRETHWVALLQATVVLLLGYGAVRLRLRMKNLRATGAR
jgi:hypothetical protein